VAYANKQKPEAQQQITFTQKY